VWSGIVESPEKYRWSSVAGHIHIKRDEVLSHDCHLTYEIKDWLGYLNEKGDKQLIEEIRKNSLTGRPCGDNAFIQKIEGIVGRRLKALPWGRPRKDKK